MGRQDWRTAPAVFKTLSEYFGPFDCDVAADEHNHLCERWIGPDHPFEYGWKNWCNPPFENIGPFVDAAIKIITLGRSTVMLTHSNCCSPWFRRASQSAALYLPDRRLCFWHPNEKPSSPDRDTVIWYFGRESGRVFLISIPPHQEEVSRLWAEANGQKVLF